MAASKYDELVKAIPRLVGGTENVSQFTHCVTRLRFEIKDKEKVDMEKIKRLPEAKGAQWSGNQLQVIIGGGVEEAYNLICETTGLGERKNTDSSQVSKKKFRPGAVLDVIAGCITPVVTLLIGTGMIKVIMLLGTMTGLISAGSSTYGVLSFVSDSAFYFLPVLVGFAAAARFGMNPYMGALLGAMLLHPDFTAMVSGGKAVSVFGLPVYAGSYANSIFPVILSVWAASYVEKFLKKHSPELLRSILVPFVTVLVMIPVSLCLLAPCGDIIGIYFSKAIVWIYETFGFIGVALFTGLHPLMVTTGMHHGVTPYLVASLSNPGYEALASPATFIDNINIGMAALAVSIKTKSKRVRVNSLPSGITAVLGGVTEPALFGTVLQFRPVLISTMIGGFVGGAVAGLAKCVCYSFAGSYGVFGLFTFIGEKGMPNFYWMLVAVAAGAAATFILTFISFKDKPEDLEEETTVEEPEFTPEVNEKKTAEILVPVTGEVKNLKECPDAVFAEGMVGKGIMIEPEEGKVYAPCDGEIATVFDTLHAIGIRAANGAEVLIHVGLDTVSLNGQGFKAYVKTGDPIKAGQLLLEFDMEFIKSKGLLLATPVIITNADAYPGMTERLGKAVHGDEMILLQ